MERMAEGAGYSWSGTLGATNVPSLYSRCANLRLSGQLELADGPRSICVDFIGGDPVATRGGSTQDARSFSRGTFRIEQRVPDLGGALTSGVELSGDLGQARPRDLIRHCEDARLSCDLELEKPDGERARVRFAHGHVETTEVNGKPELAALARITGWLDGRFQILLRPLFADDAPRTPPPMLRTSHEQDDLFDFTQPIKVGLGDDDSLPLPVPLQDVTPSPMQLPIATGRVPGTPLDAPAWSAPRDGASRLAEAETEQRPAVARERTELTTPLPPPPQSARRMSAAADESTSMVRNPPPRRRPRRWTYVAVPLTLLLVAAGATPYVCYYFGVALPFKLPFKLPGLPAPPTPGELPMVAVPERGGPERVGPERAEPERPPKKLPERHPVVDDGEKGEPERPPKHAERPERRPAAEQRLVDKTRRLLVEGHTHTALEAIASARKIAPKDKLLDALEKMARGKSGKGELVIDGDVVIDGKEFSAGKRLKLPAGPHLIGAGDEAHEIDLGKGEKRHVGGSSR